MIGREQKKALGKRVEVNNAFSVLLQHQKKKIKAA